MATELASSSRKEEFLSPTRKSSSSPTPKPGIRRALTVDESAQFRHRPSQSRFSTFETPHPARTFETRRRSYNFSDLSLSDARKSFASSTDDILLPRGTPVGNGHEETSGWHSAPLAFALLPALGGMLFQNGGAVVTDVMLLGLAGIFLNWSVRVPWDWYHSARLLRVVDSVSDDEPVIDDSADELDELSAPPDLTSVPEDPSSSIPQPPKVAPDPVTPRRRRKHHSEAATSELYTHELLALLACFIAPILGAYLLHSIRSSLSRPSEGLVSNYNLTIFLLASELRPLSHLVKLVQARTLHLQRLVAINPHLPSTSGSPNSALVVTSLLKRVDELEANTTKASSDNLSTDAGAKPSQSTAAEVRKSLQPELDALNRAVRRYEKRATLQTMQTEARLRELEGRVGDAVSLAAAASRQRVGTGGLGEGIWALVELPFWMVGVIMALPFKIAKVGMEIGKRAVVGTRGDKGAEGWRKGTSGKGQAGSGSGSGGASGYRMGGERVKVQGLKR